MAVANIVITGVSVTPNPVNAGETIYVRADIQPIIEVIGDDNARVIDNDGAYIAVSENT